jgi:hypothetical protein
MHNWEPKSYEFLFPWTSTQKLPKTIELLLKSPCLWPSFTPYPLFQWYLQSKEILLNLNTENSAFNAQGSRVLTVVVQVGAVIIYVAAAEALREKERQDETQFTTKIGWKTSLGPSFFVL